MTKTYRLKESIEIEHELKRGPRPSGYAKFKLKLVPNSTFVGESDELPMLTDVKAIGKFRETSYHELPQEEKLREYLPRYIQMAMSGIQAGCLDALKQSLDHPVSNIDILVDELVFDFVYSTEAASYFASKSAISQLLQRAKSRGLLMP